MSQHEPDTPAPRDSATKPESPARQWHALSDAAARDSGMATALRAGMPIPPTALVAVAAIFDVLFAADAAIEDPDESEE